MQDAYSKLFVFLHLYKSCVDVFSKIFEMWVKRSWQDYGYQLNQQTRQRKVPDKQKRLLGIAILLFPLWVA